ncbi:hypothetical protein RIF29_01899 [Crotalaria pallida]|uniref:Uncharacterized protein n=1 Tax=Crotalaria pallida TaxID=3830 RepID=A0AAN9P7N4_CROPI
MKSQFPDFSLEDKTDFEGEGSDEARNQRGQLLDQNNHSPKGWQVYTRRKKGTRGNQKGGELVRIHMGSEFNGLGLGTYHSGSVRLHLRSWMLPILTISVPV